MDAVAGDTGTQPRHPHGDVSWEDADLNLSDHSSRPPRPPGAVSREDGELKQSALLFWPPMDEAIGEGDTGPRKDPTSLVSLYRLETS